MHDQKIMSNVVIDLIEHFLEIVLFNVLYYVIMFYIVFHCYICYCY